MSTTDDIDADDLDAMTGEDDAEEPIPLEDGDGAQSPTVRIRSARFREKLRGYHPADVDTFLEKLALVVEDLEARLADATERLEEAERRSAVATAGEQTVRRTLVLAQRTAELAVTEAQNRAASIVAEADAEAEARIAAVEEECVAVREREEQQLREEIERLETAHAEAAERFEALEERRAEEHDRLTEALAELAAVVDARLVPPQ